MLPLKAESYNCENGGVDDGLHEDDLGVTCQVPEGPGVLNPDWVKLQRHALFILDLFLTI